MRSFSRATTRTSASATEFGGRWVATAAVAWMEVTMKCVQCHKYVRDERPPKN